MVDIITGNIILTGSGYSITNIKRLLYEWVPNTYEPQFVMGTVGPVGFKLPHKYVRGEIDVLSEQKTWMDNYVKSGSNNVALNFIASGSGTTGSSWLYTFSGSYILNESMTINDGEDVVTIYPFVAKMMWAVKS